ncbi:MAG: hypothetical protein Q8P62_04120 [Candidatus Peregrinibacteria bacterium]|nr:hypothetical protein [Candidatus Peregrinibacteria bacterium]
MESQNRIDDPEESEDYGDATTQPVKISSPEDNSHDETGTLAKRIIHLCLIFVILGFFGTSIIGMSSLSIKTDISENKSFIKVAEEMRPNFEDSLLLYTGNTQKVIDFLLKLRPQTEEEFITFITTLESLGKELSLNLDIRTIDDKDQPTDKTKSKNDSITYNINFYGDIKDMQSFVTALDKIPYYVKISNIKYQNLSLKDGAQDKKLNELTNISIEIQLFIKKRNAN